jgi:hypothetical protein
MNTSVFFFSVVFILLYWFFRGVHFVVLFCLQISSFCLIVLFTDKFILLNCFVYRDVHFVELFCLRISSFCWIVLFTDVFILLNCFVYRGVHFVKQNELICKQNNSTKWTPLKNQFNKMKTSVNKKNQQNEHLCKQNNLTKWTPL